MITETKLAEGIPIRQFLKNGFNSPFHFDRDRSDGGIFLYIREDL